MKYPTVDLVLAALPKGYSMEFQKIDEGTVEGILSHRGTTIGSITGHIEEDSIMVGSVHVEPEYRNAGFGIALYEGLFREARKLGIKKIFGNEITPEAHRIHLALKRRYKTDYQGSPGDFYQYSIPRIP